MGCCSTIVGTPVVNNGRTGNPKQPGPAMVCATLRVKTTHGFEKDLWRQVLSLLVGPHVAVNVAVDQVKMLLREDLTVLFFYPCSRLHAQILISELISLVATR